MRQLHFYDSVKIDLFTRKNFRAFDFRFQEFHESQGLFVFWNFSPSFVQAARAVRRANQDCFCRAVFVSVKCNRVEARLNDVLNERALQIEFFQNQIYFVAI